MSWVWLRDRLTGVLVQLLATTVAIATLVPVYWIAATSIQPYGTFVTTKAQFVPLNPTFQPYREVIFATRFLLWMRNSFLVTFPAIILTVTLAAPAAYALSRGKFRGKEMLLGMILMIQFLPTLTTLMPLFLLFRELHLLNLGGLALLYIALSLPFSIWNLKLYFDTVPLEIEENACIDGASTLQILRHIVLPLAAPALFATCAFVFILCWSEYIVASIILLDSRYYTVAVAFGSVASIWLQLAIPWPQFAAMAVMTSIPFVIVFILGQRYIQAGLMRGALRG
ncbi:MAG: carbohydrate ABC transporter permease [Chloroflexi bacterium]|nr:carbohydrate ABC transporter permease [Chloroflexota bacterium]